MSDIVALDCIDCNGFGGWEVQIGCELGWHRCTTCDGAGHYMLCAKICTETMEVYDQETT